MVSFSASISSPRSLAFFSAAMTIAFNVAMSSGSCAGSSVIGSRG